MKASGSGGQTTPYADARGDSVHPRRTPYWREDDHYCERRTGSLGQPWPLEAHASTLRPANGPRSRAVRRSVPDRKRRSSWGERYLISYQIE